MGTRKRSDAATLGDLEDFADGLREVFAPLLDKPKGRKVNAPKVRDDDGDQDDDESEDEPAQREPERGPLFSVAKGWFGERAS